MLAPMLSMLKGLYESARERIGEINKREKKSKERPDLLKNATAEEDRLYRYWPRCREREHKQYHNMLKLQHATMQREKQMIDLYEKTLAAPKGGSKEVAKELGHVAQGLPEVVL